MSSPFDLRQLQHAVFLADELHFGRASDRACLSQSAFSRSIASLEQKAGVRLFDRGPGFVKPTVAGDCVIERAKRMLSSSTDLLRELNLLSSGDLGDIVVGAGPYSGASLMASAVAELQSAHPSVRVKMVITQSLGLLKQLLDEELDFFMSDTRELPANENCIVEPLGSAIGAMMCRAEHPLACKPDLALADLCTERFAAVHLPASVSRQLGALILPGQNKALELALECESVVVLREYALGTDAIVFAPEDVMGVELESGRMCRLRIKELEALGSSTPLRMELGLVRLRDRTPSRSMRTLMDLVWSCARSQLIAPNPNISKAHD